MMPTGRGPPRQDVRSPQQGPAAAAGTAAWGGPAVPEPGVPGTAVPRAGLAEDRRQGQPRSAGQRQGRRQGALEAGARLPRTAGQAASCPLPGAGGQKLCDPTVASWPASLAKKKICRQKAMPFQWVECLSLAMLSHAGAGSAEYVASALPLSVKIGYKAIAWLSLTSWPASAPTQARMLLLASAAHFSGVFLHTLPCFRADPAGQDCCP